MVLAQLLPAGLPASIGFWDSFPHSHRRLEEALLEKRSLWRKRFEYFWAARKERRLIRKCAFYLPITETHKSVYYPELTIPYLPTPMGFDFNSFPVNERIVNGGPIRFVYIGTIDALRRFDIVNNAFLAQDEDFLLDYYSFQQNREVERIKQIGDRRIRFRGGLPRNVLLPEIASADIGICFFPHTKTYITASPTKTLEYGAMGMTALCNPMPEYKSLLDESCAFLCNFNETAIRSKVKAILSKDRALISEMGRKLRHRIMQHRNYEDMADRLFAFLEEQLKSRRQRAGAPSLLSLKTAVSSSAIAHGMK